MNLIGRNEGKVVLDDFLKSDRPEFLAIYDRRRVGKTFLIKQTLAEQDCFFFNVTGGAKEAQINLFTKEISKVFELSVIASLSLAMTA